MEEMTLEQQRALAMAAARQRMAESETQPSKAWNATILPIAQDEGGNYHPAVPGLLKSLYNDFMNTGPRHLQDAATPRTEISDSDVGPLTAGGALSTVGLINPIHGWGPTKTAAPTREALEAAKTAAYQHPNVSELRVAPEVGPRTVSDVQRALIENKLDPINAPDVLRTIGNVGKARFEQPTTQPETILRGPGYHIAEDVAKPAPLSIADFDLTRQSLSGVPLEQRRAASIARKVIDEYLGSVPESDVVSGNAAAANAKLLEARGNAAALFRDKDVMDALGRAENQAGSTYSGGNLENATRQQLRPLLNEKMGVSKKKAVFKDYTNDETAALKKAVVGTTYGNIVRGTGKALGGGGGAGNTVIGGSTAAIAAALGLDPVSAAALGFGTAAAGRGINAYGAKLANKRAQAVSELLRSRSPLAQSQVGETRSPLVAALLARQWPGIVNYVNQ